MRILYRSQFGHRVAAESRSNRLLASRSCLRQLLPRGGLCCAEIWVKAVSSLFPVALLALALTLGMAPRATAAEQLDWTGCVREALANNPSLTAAHAASTSATAAVTVANAAFLPQLSLQASAFRLGSNPVGGLGPAVDTTGTPIINSGASGGSSSSGHSTTTAGSLAILQQPLSSPFGLNSPWSAYNQYSYGLTLQQNLYNGGRDQATKSQREAELISSRGDESTASVQAAFDLRSAFLQQLYAQALIDLQAEVEARRQENVRLVTLRFEGGAENKGSVLKAQALMQQARADRQSAARQLGVAKATLARLLGRPFTAGQRPDFLVRGSFAVPVLPPAPDLTQVIDATPAHQGAVAKLHVAEAALRGAYGEAYPTLAASASASRSGSDWPPNSNQVAFGLTLNVPIYSGGSQAADVRVAAADKARAAANLLVADLQAGSDVAQAYAGLQDASATVGIDDGFVKAADLQAEIARNQYSLGLTSFQDWDLLENALIDAQRALLGSRRDAALAQASWDKALGRTLAEVGG